MMGLVMAAAFWTVQANSQELTGTLKKVKETGTITIGYRDSSIPFSYLDDNQKPIGFAIDICLSIVDAVKKELKLDQLRVEFNPVTSSTRIPLLSNGTVDLECGSTTNNPERLKQVAFTNTHFLTATRFVSKKASNLNSIDDLKGKSVVSSAGTTNIRQLTEANAARNLGINIIPAKDTAETFLMLSSGRAAGTANDDGLAYATVATSRTPDDFVIGSKGLEMAPYGIVEPKDDPAFKKVVDEAVIDLIKNGQIAALYDKYFNSPIPPHGINLKFPMSAALKKALANPTDSGDPAAYE